MKVCLQGDDGLVHWPCEALRTPEYDPEDVTRKYATACTWNDHSLPTYLLSIPTSSVRDVTCIACLCARATTSTSVF
jgi:hypothetical protein